MSLRQELDYRGDELPSLTPEPTPKTDLTFHGHSHAAAQRDRFERTAQSVIDIETHYERWRADDVRRHAKLYEFENAAHWFIQRVCCLNDSLSSIEDVEGMEPIRRMFSDLFSLLDKLSKARILIDPKREDVLIDAYRAVKG